MPDPVRTKTYTADIESFAAGSENYAVTLYDAAFLPDTGLLSGNRFLASRNGSGALSFDLNEPFGDVFFPRIWVYHSNGHWLQIAGAAQGTVGSGYGRIDADGSGPVWYSDDLPYADMPKYCSFRLTFTRR
jgi:hypothetical protein